MHVNGRSTWAASRMEDLSAVPDVTMQASRILYMADFEQSTDRSGWTPSSNLVSDSTKAHSGAFSAHLSAANTSGSSSISRSFIGVPGSTYHVTGWVKTIASGSASAASGGVNIWLRSTASTTSPTLSLKLGSPMRTN